MTRRAVLSAWRADDRGVAAIEAAFVCTMLGLAVMNVLEVSRYAYISAQVAAVTQAAAQAAVINCDTSQTPVTTRCSGLANAIQAALQGSSLGSAVKLKPGTTTEAWYCVADDGLKQVADAGSPPENCADVGAPAAEAGLYLQIHSTYDYQPIFPGLTVAETFSKTIERSAWMRTQ